MRIAIPPSLTGKELFNYLATNKAKLIQQKRLAPVKGSATFTTPGIIQLSNEETTAVLKSIKATEPNKTEITNNDILKAKIIGNTAWWCDDHLDVLVDTAYDRTVKERGLNIVHIHDHKWESTSHVGDTQAVYVQQIKLADIGIQRPGVTTVFAHESIVRKDYNEKAFLFYKAGKMKEHSIGLQYVALDLAINDAGYTKEFELWNKYYNRIINKEKVDESGYFWIVYEVKIFETSCVLFGASEVTPAFLEDIANENEIGKQLQQPPNSIVVETPKKISIDFAALI